MLLGWAREEVGNGCDALRRSTTDALLGGREKWTARWKRAVLLGWAGEEVGNGCDALRTSTTDALLGGRDKWTARWKRAVLLGWAGEGIIDIKQAVSQVPEAVGRSRLVR